MSALTSQTARLHALAVGVGLLALSLVHFARYWGSPPIPLLYGAAALVGFPVVGWVLHRGGYRGDALLLPVTAAIVGLGLAQIYRLQPSLMLRQATWVCLGFALLLGTLQLARDPSRLARYRYLSAAAALSLLGAALVFGVERGGARQWIDLGFVSFQPSEAVKVLLVVFLAAYLSEHGKWITEGRSRPLELRALGPVVVMLALSLLLLVVQRDLGGALLYFAIVLLMVYAATGRGDYVLVGAAAFVVGAAVCYLAFAHVRVRIDAWVDPWRDLPGAGYQIAQALFALGSGGLVGTGLGLGHPDLIPAVHTDLIFAAVAEELGFAGAVGVILLYALLLARAFGIALRAQPNVSRLLATGAACVLAVQTLLILGGATRLLPLTGITLPFMSYGGSSIVSNFVLLGLLHAVSHEAASPIRRSERQDGRPHP
ncbi:MAG: FtsW/RodA/SpoVE family cell cycle protein [Armatimonadota bacterium]|nr:FtsW/RodA/SpoVE family cell cycle protein [Armatimonadota bacterium]MDR5696660.1 FtsW/RodA/SpoVE family cell cycle protein [Armatimonadota bacterium]